MPMNRAAGIVALVTLLASACGSSAGTVAQGSPSASTSPSALASTPTPTLSPSPSPASSPRPSAGGTATLNCRLPVIASASSGTPPGGWVTFPGGQFVRDPGSLRNRASTHVPSYDRAIGGWVPVEYENVSPDGASYVLYHDPTTAVPNALYIVNAKTGNRRLIPAAQAPGSNWYAVLDYASEGIYLAAPGEGMAQPVPGLWLLDPKTGGIRQIESSHVWFKLAGGAAWSIEPWVPGAASYKVYRLDLRTGQVAIWYETKTAIQPVSPTAEGGLLVADGVVGAYHLAVLTAPKTYVPIRIPASFDVKFARLARPGVWFSQLNGLALYTKAEGIRIFALSAGDVPGGYGFFYAAGGCW